jgi:hypothetical protein
MAEINGTIAQVTHQNNTDHYVVLQMSDADFGSFKAVGGHACTSERFGGDSLW